MRLNLLMLTEIFSNEWNSANWIVEKREKCFEKHKQSIHLHPKSEEWKPYYDDEKPQEEYHRTLEISYKKIR